MVLRSRVPPSHAAVAAVAEVAAGGLSRICYLPPASAAFSTTRPWGGFALEWATSSPPPEHNFDWLPPIRSDRPVFDARMAAAAATTTGGVGSVTGVPSQGPATSGGSGG